MRCTLAPALVVLVASTVVSCAVTPSASSASIAPSSPTAAVQDGATISRLGVYVGRRDLGEDDWAPLEDQPTLGIEFSSVSESSGLGLELALMGSYDDDRVGGVDVEASTGEVSLGIRKEFGLDGSGMYHGAIHPHLGAGVAWVRAELDAAGGGASDDDGSFAGYGHAALHFDIASHFAIAIDVRALFGSDIEIFGADADTDYVQLALVLSFEL